MRILAETKLDFKDVLIVPKRSKMPSRKNVQLNKNYKFLNSEQTWDGFPLIGANMDVVGTFDMAHALASKDMLTCLHKHYDTDQLVKFFSSKKNGKTAFYTMGIKDHDLDKLDVFYHNLLLRCGKEYPVNICIDVANGYTEYFQDRVKIIREKYPKSIIMAGNVVTPEMVAELLISGGADIVKVGIGSGSVCTTRKMTGVGYPQLSAIIECADAAHGLNGHICADGGCTEPGDVVKAFGAGADFVMLGGMLAGHDECEGEWETKTEVIRDEATASARVTGKQIKTALRFYGMSSKEAQNKYDGGVADYKAAEGKCVTVPYRGPVVETLQDIEGGLRSACAYVGASSLKELPKCTTFVQVNRPYNTIFG